MGVFFVTDFGCVCWIEFHCLIIMQKQHAFCANCCCFVLCLSVCLSPCLPACLPACQPACLSLCLCLSVSLSLSLSLSALASHIVLLMIFHNESAVTFANRWVVASCYR